MRFSSLIMPLMASLAILSPAWGFEIILPDASTLIYESDEKDSISLPTGRYGLVSRPSESILGRVDMRAWRIAGTDSSSELMEQLIAQYGREGFEVQWQCETDACGGFDFRYGIETAPPPEFKVNLEQFYYVDLRQPEGNEIVTILLSALDNEIYLQQTAIEKFEDLQIGSFTTEKVVFETNIPSPEENDTNTARLVLYGVEFDSGSSTPSKTDPQEMQQIATRLADNPKETVYIVGHSDQTGSLSANISITKARASAVRKILIDEYGVDGNRILSDGVGFLAPIADNAIEEGRAQNRRVEAVFLVN